MKNTIILLTILLFFLPFCQGQKEKINIKVDTLLIYYPPYGAFDKSNNEATVFLFYFPLGVLKPLTPLVDSVSWLDTHYSGNLYLMKEPVIYTDTSHNEIYRFTWLRSFHNPITIRIEKQDGKYMLYWKYFVDLRDDPNWKLYDARFDTIKQKMIVKQQEIDENRWIEFKNLLHQIDFWNMETNKRIMGFDGADWILEGKTNSQYHVVDRWSPDRKNKYYQTCDFLIKLTDLKIRNVNKY